MKSVRIHPELEARLKEAASVRGESLSEFIRRAAAERADTILDARPAPSWDDVIGVVRGGGGRARRTGEEFSRALREKSAE